MRQLILRIENVRTHPRCWLSSASRFSPLRTNNCQNRNLLRARPTASATEADLSVMRTHRITNRDAPPYTLSLPKGESNCASVKETKTIQIHVNLVQAPKLLHLANTVPQSSMFPSSSLDTRSRPLPFRSPCHTPIP